MRIRNLNPAYRLKPGFGGWKSIFELKNHTALSLKVMIDGVCTSMLNPSLAVYEQVKKNSLLCDVNPAREPNTFDAFQFLLTGYRNTLSLQDDNKMNWDSYIDVALHGDRYYLVPHAPLAAPKLFDFMQDLRYLEDYSFIYNYIPTTSEAASWAKRKKVWETIIGKWAKLNDVDYPNDWSFLRCNICTIDTFRVYQP